jgi:hypothetical protein
LERFWPPFEPCVIMVTGVRVFRQPNIDTSLYRLVWSREDRDKQVDLYAKPELLAAEPRQ